MSALTGTVLVLGANGRFGKAAVRAFADAGWRVRAQVRSNDQNSPAGVEAVVVDAMQGDALCHAAQGADVIVNALSPIYTEWDRFALPLAANALAAAKTSGALLMYPANIYNFGSRLPAQLTTNTPWVGNTSKAKIRIQVEEQLRAAAASGVSSVVIRAGDFFGGEGRGSWFDLVIAKSLAKGKMTYPGPLDLPHAWAYLPDLAETFVRLANQHGRLHGANCFHFPGYTITGSELHHALEAASGRSLRVSTLPWGFLRIAGLVAAMPRALLEMRYLWQRPHTILDGALAAVIGEVPKTPLPEALTGALTALGLHHHSRLHTPLSAS